LSAAVPRSTGSAASAVQDGNLTTTAGMTSGVVGALRLVEQLANAGALRMDRVVVPGVGSIEEVDSQLLGWAADRGLNVELPDGGQAAGQFSFDAMPGDLATVAIGIALVPAAATRRNRR
jgi:hypothetical protein